MTFKLFAVELKLRFLILISIHQLSINNCQCLKMRQMMNTTLLKFLLFINILSIGQFASSDELKPIIASPSHPQGEIWSLREAGAIAEANQLEGHIMRVLKHDPITSVFLTDHNGASISYLVQFSNNIFAIMKEADPLVPKSVEYEVVAFRLDRALNLNMVPVTVSREYFGKKVSLQLIVPTRHSQKLSELQTDWQNSKLNDLDIFDSIILNYDRIIDLMHNVLISEEGRIVAIDHSRLMKKMQQTVWREANEISPDFLQHLMKFDEQKLNQILGDLLDSDDLALIKARMKITKVRMEESARKNHILIAPMNNSKVFKYPQYSYEVPTQLKSIFNSNALHRPQCKSIFQ